MVITGIGRVTVWEEFGQAGYDGAVLVRGQTGLTVAATGLGVVGQPAGADVGDDRRNNGQPCRQRSPSAEPLHPHLGRHGPANGRVVMTGAGTPGPVGTSCPTCGERRWLR